MHKPCQRVIWRCLLEKIDFLRRAGRRFQPDPRPVRPDSARGAGGGQETGYRRVLAEVSSKRQPLQDLTSATIFRGIDARTARGEETLQMNDAHFRKLEHMYASAPINRFFRPESFTSGRAGGMKNV